MYILHGRYDCKPFELEFDDYSEAMTCMLELKSDWAYSELRIEKAGGKS